MIVVGLGAVGSAATHALAKRGHRVLGIDQFSPPHHFGSSHGETRIIRKSYFEHPGYVPLLCRAYELWHILEQEVSEKLYHATGLIEIGPEDGVVIPGVRQSATVYDLPIEEWSMADAKHRIPVIQGNDEWSVIFEKDAGYLLVESCIHAFLRQAAKAKAELKMDCRVTGWQTNGAGVAVQAGGNEYFASRLILAAGPWANDWLSQIKIPLKILHKQLYWYEAPETFQESQGFPCFFFETPTGCFYGFPKRDSHGLKVARHSGGKTATGAIDGSHPNDPADQALVEAFMSRHLPTVSMHQVRSAGCYYTMTRDEHFIVDRLPDSSQVIVVAGLSGHGFKFASVLGEIAASLATDEQVPFDLEFLRLARFMK